MQPKQHNILPFALSLGVYIAVLIVSLGILAEGIASKPVEILVALSPMIPAIWVLWQTIRQIRQLDELQRKVHLEALAFASAATALGTFSYGFLENIGFPQMPTHIVLPLICLLWQAGLMIGRLRYR